MSGTLNSGAANTTGVHIEISCFRAARETIIPVSETFTVPGSGRCISNKLLHRVAAANWQAPTHAASLKTRRRSTPLLQRPRVATVTSLTRDSLGHALLPGPAASRRASDHYRDIQPAAAGSAH